MTNQTLSPRPTPTPDDEPTAPAGPVACSRSSAPRRRTLLAVFLFVLVAGFFGGPLAGSLDLGRLRHRRRRLGPAVERIEAATGRDPGTGIVLSSTPPTGLPADTDRVQR